MVSANFATPVTRVPFMSYRQFRECVDLIPQLEYRRSYAALSLSYVVMSALRSKDSGSLEFSEIIPPWMSAGELDYLPDGVADDMIYAFRNNYIPTLGIKDLSDDGYVGRMRAELIEGG